MPTLMQDRIWGDKDGGRSHPRVCLKKILLLYYTGSSMLFTRTGCNKQKMISERNEGEREGEITWGETDDDYDKRNWIWLKDSKVLSLNSNIKAIVEWEH